MPGNDDDRHEESKALVHHAPTQGEVMRPLDPDKLVESFQEYVALRGRILTPDDYQSAGRGNAFVKKSGWRKIATAFGLNLELVRDEVERDEDGQITRATVWARAIAPNGRFADGDGHCSVAESRFSGPRGNKEKLENDLRGTAATRATNRAISNLVGMGEVSAEEMGQQAEAGPPHGQEANGATLESLARAVEYLGAEDHDLMQAIIEQFGYVPHAAAGGIILLAKQIKTQREAEAAAQEGDE